MECTKSNENSVACLTCKHDSEKVICDELNKPTIKEIMNVAIKNHTSALKKLNNNTEKIESLLNNFII